LSAENGSIEKTDRHSQSKMKQYQITVIGCGNMGAALVYGLCNSAYCKPAEICCYDTDSSKTTTLQRELGISVATELNQACSESRIILVAVKPSIVSGILAEIKSAFGSSSNAEENPLLISVAAGVAIKTMSAVLGSSAETFRADVARVIPNLACSIAKGVSAYYCQTEHACSEIEKIFSSVGIVVRVSAENDIDTATALASSGIGFFFEFLDAFAVSGEKLGLPKGVALQLAAGAMIGAGAMCLESSDSPATLRDKVTSPNGTTLAGLKILSENSLKETLDKALQAATKRAAELREGN